MLKIVVCDDDALCCKEIVKGIRDTLGSTPADISDFRDPTLLLEHLRKTDCQPHIALLDICMPEQEASVCPYGIIKTNGKTQCFQGFQRLSLPIQFLFQP